MFGFIFWVVSIMWLLLYYFCILCFFVGFWFFIVCHPHLLPPLHPPEPLPSACSSAPPTDCNGRCPPPLPRRSSPATSGPPLTTLEPRRPTDDPSHAPPSPCNPRPPNRPNTAIPPHPPHTRHKTPRPRDRVDAQPRTTPNRHRKPLRGAPLHPPHGPHSPLSPTRPNATRRLHPPRPHATTVR